MFQCIFTFSDAMVNLVECTISDMIIKNECTEILAVKGKSFAVFTTKAISCNIQQFFGIRFNRVYLDGVYFTANHIAFV